MTAWDPAELAQLEARQARQRRRLLARTRTDVLRVLDNTDGFERLAQVTEEEWAAVASEDVTDAA